MDEYIPSVVAVRQHIIAGQVGERGGKEGRTGRCICR